MFEYKNKQKRRKKKESHIFQQVSNGRSLLFVDANVLQTKRDDSENACAVNCVNELRKWDILRKCLCVSNRRRKSISNNVAGVTFLYQPITGDK